MINYKVPLAAFIIAIIGFSTISLLNTQEFKVTDASFDQNTSIVTINLLIRTSTKLRITTPTTSLFEVEIVDEYSSFISVVNIAGMAITTHEIPAGTTRKVFHGTLVFSHIFDVIPEFPTNVTFVVHMSKDYTTPPYTMSLR